MEADYSEEVLQGFRSKVSLFFAGSYLVVGVLMVALSYGFVHFFIQRLGGIKEELKGFEDRVIKRYEQSQEGNF